MATAGASTIGELRACGYQIRSVKDELRDNLIKKLQNNETVFPGIIGYDQTVVPEIENAILAKHDIILLGLRGQAKTRLLRSLPGLLDEAIPIIRGCEINDNPFQPICQACTDKVRERGDDVEIEWISREQRYGEKLATPDVTIADIIGDIDPIKAAALRLHYAHEGVIHFGLIPRMNRGIFAINELPDLQPRIQVGLLNILEEKDIQIRGFPIRIPLDVLIVFSANPEDYTNRGNIITPLKDRIDSQILTHYPRTRDVAIAITDQEAWVDRPIPVHVPGYFREIIEEIAFQARTSEFIDQKSGVSARLPIACLENFVSNVEKRAILLKESVGTPRICDLAAVIPAMTGKLELVYEGEQEGAGKVAAVLIGRAVKEIFKQHFPDAYHANAKNVANMERSYYQEILDWFENEHRVDVADRMDLESYFAALDRVPELRRIAAKHMPVDTRAELAAVMEFLLEGLHQNSRLNKRSVSGVTSYSDMMGSIFEK